MASWRHQFDDGSSVQLQTYYDETGRFTTGGGAGFLLDTYDIELQHSFALDARNAIIWGIGERQTSYRFENTALQLVPSSQTLNLANIFVQDTFSISNQVKLTVGIKGEDEPYVGPQLMPSVRLSWKAADPVLVWAAISRAVRSPTPVDENLREYAGTVDFLNGSSGFRPENLLAYELGTRVQATPRLSFSVSTYYDVYDHLRTIEPSAAPGGLPLAFGNLMSGVIYGVEVWANARPTDWWQLAVGFNLLDENLQFDAGSSGIGGLAFAADDPHVQASLRSTINLGHGVSWYADARFVGALPHPALPAYAEMDTRLAWQVTKTVELSLSGFNLLHPRHQEFLEDGETDYVPRSFFLEARFRF
jgi:iron complex outermembrane receptor protein